MAPTTFHNQLETSAGQHSRSTVTTAPKMASPALQGGGLAASQWAEESSWTKVSRKASIAPPKPAMARGDGNGQVRNASGSKSDWRKNSDPWRLTSPRPTGASRKRTNKRALVDGKRQPTLNAFTPRAPATGGAWSAIAVLAPTPEVAAAQRLSESELAVLLKRESFDWADEMEELEEMLETGTPAAASPSTLSTPPTQEATLKAAKPVAAASSTTASPSVQKVGHKAAQPLVATPILSSTLDEHDERVNALIEELVAAQELRRKAHRRALLCNLPGLRVFPLPVPKN